MKYEEMRFIMKKLFIMALLCAAALNMQAGDYKYLLLTASDNTESTIDVTNDVTITFADGKLMATSGGATVATLPLSNLSKMAFTNETSGIESISFSNSPNATCEVYNLKGMSMGTYTTVTAAQQLPAGVYIFKQNGASKKVVIK
jgi:hypothetical protein